MRDLYIVFRSYFQLDDNYFTPMWRKWMAHTEMLLASKEEKKADTNSFICQRSFGAKTRFSFFRFSKSPKD